MLNLIIFPFHSMCKNQKDGFRNRDGHFIESFAASSHVGKVVVVNRPITFAEVVYSKTTWKTKGIVVRETKHARLVQLSKKLFSIDYLSYDIIGNIRQGKNWFWQAYSNPEFIDFIKFCVKFLEMESYSCIHHNVYSSSIAKKLDADIELFDAFDNWLKFPMFKSIFYSIRNGYLTFSTKADIWITNSEENMNYFKQEFAVQNCEVMKNGVDKERFVKEYSIPDDLVNIKRPIIGFGGTITHLFDDELFNKIVSDHPDKSFVVIGKVLDKDVFSRLSKASNFYFLGNKHYNEYPAYVKHFNVCIITYHSAEKTHGGDSLKFYEYLASGKNMVSTSGNGIFKAHENVFISDDYKKFSSLIDIALSAEPVNYQVPSELTWSHKTDYLLSKIQEANVKKKQV